MLIKGIPSPAELSRSQRLANLIPSSEIRDRLVRLGIERIKATREERTDAKARYSQEKIVLFSLLTLVARNLDIQMQCIGVFRFSSTYKTRNCIHWSLQCWQVIADKPDCKLKTCNRFCITRTDKKHRLLHAGGLVWTS